MAPVLIFLEPQATSPALASRAVLELLPSCDVKHTVLALEPPGPFISFHPSVLAQGSRLGGLGRPWNHSHCSDLTLLFSLQNRFSDYEKRKVRALPCHFFTP